MAVVRAAAETVETGVVAVEGVQALIDRLVHERQRLRSTGAAPAELEANRLAIVYWQRRLGTELAARAGR